MNIPPANYNDLTESAYIGLLSLLETLDSERLKLTRKLRVTENLLRNVQSGMSAQSYLGEQMSEQKETQERLTRLLLENWPDLVLVFDNDMKFIIGSVERLSKLGINANTIFGSAFRRIFNGIADDDWIEHTEHNIRNAIREKARVLYAEKIRFTASKAARFYEISVVPFGVGQNGTSNVMMILHDTTDLNKAVLDAEYANKAKTQFLANMSHEIRTPMNAIIGMSDLIGKEKLTDKQRIYLDNVEKASVSLLTIIDNILDYSKIESEQLRIQKAVFNLRNMLDNICAMTFDAAKSKGLEFVSVICDDVPEYIENDEVRMRQVMVNLLDNAVKYTNTGNVTLRVSFVSHRLVVEISDTGIGIRSEDIDKLFTPFEQLDLRKNRNVVGTGLGLAISKRICDLMGGAITVNSKYGEGSVFTASFPVKLVGIAEEIQITAAFSAKDALVLVVDDIDINLAIVEAQLEECGVGSVLAASGKQALQELEAHTFDLILMDQMMPTMDGIETTARIREKGGVYATLPIIALTANAVGGVRETLLSNGFDDFIVKPLDPDILRACLVKWLPAEKIEYL